MRDARLDTVPPHRLRASDLTSPLTGLRVHEAAANVAGAASDAALVLPPPFAFSHLTAARLWNLPLPSKWKPGEPLHVMRPTASAQVRRPQVVGHRGLERRDTELLRRLTVTSPAWTWVDLASLQAMAVDDLVIAGDAFVTRTPGLLDALTGLVLDGSGRRGTVKLLQALPLLRVGSGSAMETRARLVFLRGGLPEPELNASVHAEDGHFIARVDFLWRAARVIVEYEGDHHRSDRRQWQHDIARTRLLEGLGWRVIRITSGDLWDPRQRRELLTLLAALVA